MHRFGQGELGNHKQFMN